MAIVGSLEEVYRDEWEAHQRRRKLISLGYEVSLIAYDPRRDRYVFDVRGSATNEQVRGDRND